MSCIEPKKFINSTYRSVSRFSFDEKRNPQLTEQGINAFFDAILDLKAVLKNKVDRLQKTNSLFEHLTWYNNLDDDCLMRVNETISLAKELHSSLTLQYVSLSRIRIKTGIAKEEIKRFNASLDDHKESFNDVENLFFVLPADDEFVKITNDCLFRLSLSENNKHIIFE